MSGCQQHAPRPSAECRECTPDRCPSCGGGASTCGDAWHRPTTMTVFTLQVVGDRPLTINRVASMHRQAWAKHTRASRADWALVAQAMRVPHLTACTIVAIPLHANHASPQDIAACAPEVKAAIDGLRDAGVLDDDTADIVTRITFEPPRICGHNGLELRIEAAA